MLTWRHLVLGAVLVLVVGLVVQLAYLQEFALLGPWDDEGYFMLSLRQLLEGYRLYDDIRVFYGPLYFVVKWVLHGPLALPLTHDVVRITAIVFRLATTATTAWVVLRLTRSGTVAIAAFYCIAARQMFAVTEPGHPQELVALLTAALPMTGTIVEGWPWLATSSLGALVASLALVKINVGIFAALAVVASLLAVTMPRKGILWLRVVSLAASLLLPWVLLRSHLDHWGLVAVVASGGVASLAPSLLFGTGALKVSDLVRGLLTGIAVAVLLVLLAVIGGSSLARLVDCLFVFPQSLSAYFMHWPPPLTWAWVSVAMGVTGSLLVSVGPTARARPTAQLAQAARLLFGGGIVLADATTLFALIPFAWLVLLPGPAGQRSWMHQLPRLILASLAVLAPLQIFPVPGSQIWIGSLPLETLGFVCLGDGAAWFASLLPSGVRRPASAITVVVVLAGVLYFARADVVRWREISGQETPLGLVGAKRLRAFEKQGKAMRDLVTYLESSCPRFVVLPGLQSLYFWAPQPFLAPVLVPQDTRLMRDQDVARLIAALDAVPGSCLVRCPTAAPAQLDPRVNALYAVAHPRRTFGSCEVFEYGRPLTGGAAESSSGASRSP